MKMSKVVSLRLSEEEEETIEKLSKEENKGKSEVVRELIRYGKMYRTIKSYKDGKISLGKVADEIGISIADAMDLLRSFGLKADIDRDEYLEGKENLEEVW